MTVFVYDPAVAAAVDAARAAGLPRTTGQVLSLPELADLAARAGIGSDQVPDAVTESDDALILYTSGTTGQPEGRRPEPPGPCCSTVLFTATMHGRTGADVVVTALPAPHATATWSCTGTPGRRAPWCSWSASTPRRPRRLIERHAPRCSGRAAMYATCCAIRRSPPPTCRP